MTRQKSTQNELTQNELTQSKSIQNKSVESPLTQQQFAEAVEARLRAIFSAYAGGEDVAPAQVFRAEGFIEAGCCMGLMTRTQAVELMQTLHRQIIGGDLPALSGDGIHIPFLMKRAPVYPSTKD